MTLLVTYILVALIVSFLCSLLEASLLTITPSAINNAKQKGLRWGVRMEAFKNDIDRPLSAILTLNTVAHTMGAAGAGAQYARVFGNTGEAIFALPESMPLTEFVKIIEEKPFSRIPVYKGSRDEITGFVIRGEVLLAHLKDTHDTGTLADVKRPMAMAAEHTPVDVLFQRFISERIQIILVVDEFGTTVGIVSFEDIIETIFGFEIMDEKDKVADLQLHARNLWRERARKMGIEIEEEEPTRSDH